MRTFEETLLLGMAGFTIVFLLQHTHGPFYCFANLRGWWIWHFKHIADNPRVPESLTSWADLADCPWCLGTYVTVLLWFIWHFTAWGQGLIVGIAAVGVIGVVSEVVDRVRTQVISLKD